MKTLLIATAAAITCAAFVRMGTTANTKAAAEDIIKQQVVIKKKFSLGCSPDLSFLNNEDSSIRIPLLEGWGSYRMPVTVTDDSAHIYFEQGINMYYGFHIIEALASFDQATRFDKNFAMGYWGKALAYGPNINDLGYSASPEALLATQKASELSNNCTPVEKALINAMLARYSADTTQTREYLNQVYADKMKAVRASYPSSADAAALYADALMVQHPWDLYDKDYKPKTWTPEIVQTLETILNKFPTHPGACHYYIHAIEGSEHPEKGLAVAKRLGPMMPGLAHLVHMPSHIYIRSGYYAEGVTVNEHAVKSYYNYLEKYPPEAGNPFIYIVHNLHMLATCANMDGRFADAMKASNDCSNSVDSSWMDAGGFFGYLAQYVYMTPYFTLIRFGKWEEILKSQPVPASRVFSSIIWQYGQGLAYARKHEFEKANAALEAIRTAMQDPQLQDHPPAFNAGISPAGIAEKILQGVIAEERGDTGMAIDVLQDAVDREDAMLYNEPRDWPHPARQYLGNALLKAKQYDAADKVFLEDLKINPNNGWSLTGLYTSLQAQHKNGEANAYKAQAAKSFSRSDVSIPAAVF